MTEDVRTVPEPGVSAADAAAQQAPEESVPAAEETHQVLGMKLDIDFHDYLPESLEPAWEMLTAYPVLAFLLLGAIGYFIGRGLQKLIHGGVHELISTTHPDFDEQLITRLTDPLVQVLATLFLIIGLIALDMPDVLERNSIRVVISLLIFYWARSWFRASHYFLDALSRHEQHGKVFHVRTLPLYRMGVKIFLLVSFVWFFMAVWGINATAWIASAGILGIVVGFAARDTLANLISGVSIVADAPYKIGDYVVLDTGERGIVMNLGLRSTRLLTRDDVEISIPNAVIGNAKIINESGGPWVKHRIRVPIGVSYSSDLDKVVEILKSVAADNEFMVEHPAPRVRMRRFADNSIDMDFMGWIDRPEDRGRTVHQLLMEIVRRFRAEGVEIPFPQRDLHIRDGLLGPGEEDSLVAKEPESSAAEPESDAAESERPGDTAA